MRKKPVCLTILAVLIMMLSLCCGEGKAEKIGQDGVQFELRPISLLPEEYAGFRMAVVSDLVDVQATPPDGMSEDERVCYYALDEDEAKAFFDNANPVSMGPERAILWFRKTEPGLLFAQHGKTIVPLMQATNRGAKDDTGLFQKIWGNRISSNNSAIYGHARWSPDGRYVFLYEKDKWYGAQMALDDPYLLDTVTGEVFLIETDGQEKIISKGGFAFVSGGFFSKDGQYFIYTMNNTGSDRTGFVKRYNLATGELDVLCQLNCWLNDLVELDHDRLLLWGSGNGGHELLLLSESSNGCKSEKLDFELSNRLTALIPVSGDTVLLFSSSFGSGFQVLHFTEQTAEGLECCFVQDFSAEFMAETTPDELLKKMAEARDYIGFSSEEYKRYPDFARIYSISAIKNTNCFLLSFEIARSIPDTWDKRSQLYYGYLLWNPDTRRISPVCITDKPVDDLADEIVSPEGIIVGGNNRYIVYQLTERDQPVSDWYAITQDEETLSSRSSYRSSTGNYQWMKHDGKYAMTPSGVTISNMRFINEISRDEGGYRIAVSIHDALEEAVFHRIPKAIPKEKYEEMRIKLSKKNQKKLSSFFMYITPERLRDQSERESLIDKFPEIADTAMYIFIDKEYEESRYKFVEDLFMEMGYTDEEYEADKKSGRTVGKEQEFPVYYHYSDELRNQMTRTEALRLAGLCDYINFTIYNRLGGTDEKESPVRLTENSMINSVLQRRQAKEPESTLEDAIGKVYSIDGIDYHVDVVESREEGNEIKLLLSVKAYEK